jgi:TPR repeat protein
MALIEQAAGQGHAYAMCDVGGVHHVREEYEQAAKWFTKVAEARLPKASIMSGSCSTR